MRKGAVIAASLAALVLASCGGGGNTEPEKGETPELKGDPIVFGINEDSTGPGSSYSPIAGRTVRDAVDEINENGGILGRPVKVIVGNDESDPTKTPTVIRKLLDDGADVLFTLTGTAALVQAKPVVEQDKVITIASIATAQTVVEPPDNTYMYALANSTADWAKAYCGAFEAKGFSKVALLSDSTPTIEGLNEMIIKGMEAECGVDIVAYEKAPMDASDVSAQVARAKNANPDVIIVTSVGGNIEVLFHNTAAQQMPDVMRFSLASLGNQPEVWKTANPGALEGVVFMGSLDMTKESTLELQDKLRKRRGEPDYRLTAFDAQAYDSVYLLKAAIEEAGTTDSAELKKALDKIEKQPGHYGQKDMTITWSADKKLGTDGLCGLVLTEFGANNEPSGPWPDYQPEC
ncbi:ABC transporter substrate-binding protein [Enemella sp. A6]|uniref:ABC transporter substrate-binding protein n=1 Tax=Enemella sp. A6 TaxID=3440152 RepID=UPI003EBC0B96